MDLGVQVVDVGCCLSDGAFDVDGGDVSGVGSVGFVDGNWGRGVVETHKACKSANYIHHGGDR